jgi:hypothetical protein
MPIKAKRGYRAVGVHIPTAQYEMLERLAAENFRSIEQQASAMLTANLRAAEEMELNEAALSGNGRLIVDIPEEHELRDEVEERTAQ